ncbi:MAG: GDSL-type esterase/lipase family protein [Oscillospiraceae bacterium]
MTTAAKSLTSIVAALLLFIGGCSGNNTSSEISGDDTNSSITENNTSENEEMTTKTFKPTAENVKLLGRTSEYDDILWLALSASGIEFTFTGTKASVTLIGDSMVASGPEKQARFAVYIDGERTIDAQLDEAEKVYEIYSSDEAKETTVRLIKLSEAAESTFGIKDITVEGGEIAPTAQKELKIEFIGDSITCGYGVDDEVKEHHFATSTEDATKAYAYKTAQLLDADYSLVSYSGHGIISGYTTNGEKVKSQLVPDIYEKFAKSYGNYDGIYSVSGVKWDFSKFCPDFVVINLGTNDASYCGTDKEKVTDYADSYAEFLKVVRKNNPDAYIICALGVMGDSLYTGVKMAVEKYTEETGDTRVSSFRLTPQDGSTGYAADWHPTAATHDIAAQEMTDEIKRIMTEQG